MKTPTAYQIKLMEISRATDTRINLICSLYASTIITLWRYFPRSPNLQQSGFTPSSNFTYEGKIYVKFNIH